MNGSQPKPTASVYIAYYLLKYTYGLVAIAAGADKFLNYLTQWSQYLNPSVVASFGVTPAQAMMAVGVVEIIAGLFVLSKWTRLGALLVSAWLVLIALNLFSLGMYYDVAVRDIVMAVGALALSFLAAVCG